MVTHYIPVSARGELCGMCLLEELRTIPATHKVGEEAPKEEIRRHNLTQYVCCRHFAMIMGPLAAEWCLFAPTKKIPTIDEVSGSVKDMTEGMPLKERMGRV